MVDLPSCPGCPQDLWETPAEDTFHFIEALFVPSTKDTVRLLDNSILYSNSNYSITITTQP